NDMPMVCHADSPAPTASVPKMMPKGMAPTISGRISRQACKNSCERDIGAPWGPQRNRLYAAVALQRTEYRRRIDDAGRIARENGKPYPMLAAEATGRMAIPGNRHAARPETFRWCCARPSWNESVVRSALQQRLHRRPFAVGDAVEHGV